MSGRFTSITIAEIESSMAARASVPLATSRVRKPAAAQLAHRGVAAGRLVVDDQQLVLRPVDQPIRARRLSSALRVFGSGQLQRHRDREVEPRPSSLSSATVPPSSSASRLLSDSPRPVPRSRFWIVESIWT